MLYAPIDVVSDPIQPLLTTSLSKKAGVEKAEK
jgi:hypothetical protein